MGEDKGQGTPYQIWTKKATEAQAKYGGLVTVSDFLEREVAHISDRRAGFDLADYLLKRDPDFGWALKTGFPAFWDAVKDDPSLSDDYIHRLL